MPIDSSIYQNRPTVDLFGSYQEGMRMGDMLKQRKKESDLQDAYKAGMVTNPDGSVSRDDKLTMKAMLDKGYGQEAWDYQEKMQANQLAKQKQQREDQAYKMSEAGRLAGAALQNPNAWPQIRQEAIKNGYGTEETIPQAYDPKWLRGVQAQALTASEQMAQQSKDREFQFNQEKSDKDFNLKERELALKAREAAAKEGKLAGAKEGIKTLDKEFAKDHNEWTQGGATRARSEIDKINGVISRLEQNKGTTGGLTGMFGDRLTSNDVLKNRADVQGSAMTLIKQLLSGATSDSDRKAIVDTLWNEADSTENNLTRLKRFVSDMSARANNFDAKSKYFQQNQTLAGFDSPLGNVPQNQSGSGQNQSKFVQVVAPNGAIKNVPESMLQDALNAGGKLAPKKAGY